jgi:predicted ATPase
MFLAERRPLVLFLDDLQWIDSATLDLLEYAIRRWKENRVRIVFLASLRSEALHPMTQPRPEGGTRGLNQWLEGISRDLKPVHIELEPLGEQETVQMVLSFLSPPVPTFAQWLYAETGGHPYYLMETLKDLLERRVLHPRKRAAGQWSYTVDEEHELERVTSIPSTVQATIRSRLNRLSPNAFSLLAAGAVLEHRLTFKHLCAVASISEDQALPALDELISGRLLIETVQTGKASKYIFINEMMRDVVYTEAGDARRRLFHQRAFKILEKASESAAVLAHHAVASGMTKAAFQYSLVAGQEAVRLSAISEAIVHLERTRQLVQDLSPLEMPDKAALRDLYTQLGQAYKLTNQMEKALVIEKERLNL